MNRRESWLTASEWALALGLAGLLLFVHVQNWLHAPWLWRDEISTLHISTAPTLSELWTRMEWESSPLLWPLTLRGWSSLGLGSSPLALRALSLAVGVGALASLFFALRRVAGTVPLLALLLVAANPNVLRFGDTLRAYCLGLLLATLLVVALWRLTLRVAKRETFVAALLAIACVQCLYHNAVVVLALCTGCAVAWAARGRIREALVPLAVGGLAALSLLPYAGPLGRAREWNMIIRAPVDAAWLLAKLRATIDIGGPWLSIAWLALALAALAACAWRILKPEPGSESAASRRAGAAFFAVALVVGVAVYATFLILVGYPTQAWYYFSLLGLAAVLIESALHVELDGAYAWRVSRIALFVIGLAIVVPALWRGQPARMTNLDRVAATLAAQARPDDLILVAPWYLGIAFDHYYTGKTPWLGVPEVGDHTLTRYDLVKALMLRPDAVRPIADRAQETLQRHGRVWLVGELPLADGNPPPRAPPLAPDSPLGWGELGYQLLWSREVAHRLQVYASRVSHVPLGDLGVVSPFENPQLYRFEAAP
ncbi:MAG: hypothetical protein WEF50_13815 [Myxococcota bacterium]